MATYSLTTGDIGAYAKTLVANTVDTINFPRPHELIEVWTDGSSAVYFTTDGSTPTIGGTATYELPAGTEKAREVPVSAPGNTVVKVISVGTPKYSVTGTGGVLV